MADGGVGVLAHKASGDLEDIEDGPQVTETENQRVTLTEEDVRPPSIRLLLQFEKESY